MKTQLYILKMISIFLLIVGCSSNDDNSQNSMVIGTIELSGSDTAILGNSLTVANIYDSAFSVTGTNSSVVLLDENTTIENGELNSTDFSNGFVIVAAQFDADDNAAVEKTISMTIVKDGDSFSYVCSTPAISAADNTDCGLGYSVDKIAKLIVFNDTTVINVDSGAILLMNGTIDYN
tara:strand:+ start:471 stop:1004 length:534 start_codon:yes stop_codon:yes gene_type:complete